APAIEIVSPGRAAPTTLTLPDATIERLEGEVFPGGGVAAKGRVDLAGGSGEGRLGLGAAAPRTAADLRLADLTPRRLGAGAASVGLEGGEVEGRLRYRGSVAGGAGRVRGRVSAHGIRSASPGRAWRLRAGELTLAGLDVDLATRRFAVRQDRLDGGELALT